MSEINSDSLGRRIKVKRLNMCMTQEQLAEAMCVPKSTISAYENDKVDIKSSVILELSRVLITSPNYLLGYNEELDSVSCEIMMLLNSINDNHLKTILCAQIKAAVDQSILEVQDL